MIDAHAPDTTPAGAPSGASLADPHADLVAALGELHEPRKEGKVHAGQRQYTYLTLPDLLGEVRRVCAAHQLAVMQEVRTSDTGHLSVETVLVHASGHEFRSGPLLAHQPDAPQALGSWITYARRYSLATFVGLAGDDDDDAQKAQEAAHKPRRAPQAQQDTYGQTKPVQRVTARPDDPANEPYQSAPPPRPQAMSDDPFDPNRPASPSSVKFMHVTLSKAGHETPEQKHAAVARVFGLPNDDSWSSANLSQRAVSAIIDWYQPTAPDENPDG